MIALWAALALADPCAREVVAARGLRFDPPEVASATARYDVRLAIGKRRVDGHPTYYARRVEVDARWEVTASAPVRAWVGPGSPPSLCDTLPMPPGSWDLEPGTRTLSWRHELRGFDPCRVRLALAGSVPAVPEVVLEVTGATPPGPDAPVDGPLRVEPGGDVVIDVPACL